MRKLLLAITTAAAVLIAGSFAANRAEAMTVGTVSGLQAAVEDLSATLDVAYVCRHRYYSSRRVCWWTGYRVYRPYRVWRYRRWRRW